MKRSSLLLLLTLLRQNRGLALVQMAPEIIVQHGHSEKHEDDDGQCDNLTSERPWFHRGCENERVEREEPSDEPKRERCRQKDPARRGTAGKPSHFVSYGNTCSDDRQFSNVESCQNEIGHRLPPPHIASRVLADCGIKGGVRLSDSDNQNWRIVGPFNNELATT